MFHAFAAFIFFSNISVLFSKNYLVDTTYVFNTTGFIIKTVFYVDPMVECPSHKCVPYILLTTVVLIFISLIPSLLLCIYPTRVYRYLLRFLSAKKQLAITAFAEALHSCFRDGLNGTRTTEHWLEQHRFFFCYLV